MYSRERLTEVSVHNPCPHCGKPDWCYSIGELTACKRGNPPTDGWEATSKTDQEGTAYYAPVQEKKAIRPRQSRHWDYMDRDGNPLIRVRRFDDGEGGGSRDGKKKPEWTQYRWVNGKWVPGIEGIAREDIPIYRYAEIQNAIERNELIFIVEGEACADILWKLGLAATCNIGGSSKWRPSDSQDLSGAKVVIAPDRDEPGIKHADRIAEDFPEALWLYPFPGAAWKKPPLSKGLDIADWIEHHKITAENILAAVGERMPERQSKIQNPKPNNLLKHPANYTPEPAPPTEIIEHADNLLEEELTPTNQIIGAIAAAKRSGLSPKDFREILTERQAEQELDWSLIQSRENFQRLYQIEKTLINLHEYFPQPLAKALLTKAESDRVDPVRILQSLLPVVGATLGARIAIEVKKGMRDKDSWKEYPIFYCADVGPPSSGKSATQNTIIEPLQEMQDAEQVRADEALIQWGQLSDSWKSMSKEEKAEKAESDENPRIYHEKYCTPRKWLFDQGSAQALTKRIAEQEAQHGCLLMQDELSGFFESFDQFTAGKGNQRQFILNAWNKPLRGGVDRVDLEASYFFRSQTLSITGTIQPDVARRVFNVATDADGMVSRFLPAIGTLPRNFAKWSNVQVDIYDTMKGTIEKLRQLPECLLTMPPATKEIYIKHWESIRQLYEINLHSNPAYAFWLGKQNSYAARFAIVLHCLENLNAVELPTRITPETMHKAVRLSQFYCSQFLLLQSKSAQQQPLEGLLLDILKFIQQSGGQISTRDLCRSRFQKIAVEGKKLTTATAAKLLREIAVAGFGTFEEIGNKKIFTLNSGLSSTVINCHQVDDSSKPSHSKDFGMDCHKMTKVYVPENLDSPIDPPPETFIDESVLKPVENSENLEDIQFCHLMTVEAQIQSPQALEVDDSLMTVDDSDDSSTLNVDKTSLPASEFKVGDRVQMRSDYITPQLCDQEAVIVKDFGDDKYRIDFGRKIETPFVEPKQFFVINKQYFHHATEGAQIEDENVTDCIKFIRTAITEDDPQLAKDFQAILAEQPTEDKRKIWDSLTAEEKNKFKTLISRSDTTNTPQTPTDKEIKPVDKSGSDVDQLDQLDQLQKSAYKKIEEISQAAQELIPIEQELLAISNLNDFSDYAEWLEDPQYLESVCLSLGGQPEKFWLAHEIGNYLIEEDQAAAVEAIAKLRQRFNQEILEAAGKLAVSERRGKALAKLQQLVLASKIELADADKLREIALVWWPEYYPDQLQSLITQMFAPGCPATKYPLEMLAAWIKCQNPEVRDRLVKLCREAGRGELPQNH